MTKNRYAQVMNGVVIYIYETHLPYNKLWEIFDSSHSDFFDVTNRPEVTVGWMMGFDENGEWTIVAPQQPETLEDYKEAKLEEVLSWTNKQIVSGFESFASGESKWYDSDENDQSTYNITYMATQSPDFETHITYQGRVPVRCRATKETSFENKEVLYLDKEQYQKLMDDLAIHLGICKAKGWELQNKVNNAQTIEELDNIIME